MFKKIYSGLIALLAFAQVQAQSPISGPDSTLHQCGVTKALRDAMVVPAEPGSRFASALVPGYPSGATEVCGHFTLHYEDIRLGLLQGYNEPASGLGIMRRNNLCQVIQYIESVIDFSLVPPGGINILVDRSDDYMGMGSAGLPFLTIPPGTHPTVDGFVNSFIHTGIDPAPGQFHGMIGIDFSPILLGYFTLTPINNDYSVTEACGVDLAAMELHHLSHVLGMFSFVDEDAFGMYKTNPSATGPFTSLDLAVHTTPDPETSTDPFLPGNLFPFVSSGFSFTPSGYATDRKFWINGSQPPYNHGMEKANLTSAVWHFAGQGTTYGMQPRLSPGDYQDYVTERYEIYSGAPMRRQWTKGELEMFTTTLGYSYNPTYASAHATAIANHVPYSTKMGSNAYNHVYNPFDGPEKIPADFTITNDVGTSLVIDITADATLQDADGDRISIFPGSLVNFRGCGQGGNNHNLLSVNGASNVITYTPREDFYGRAQFGFNLFDGTEKGAFVTYTIDVRKGTNVAIPPGENIVLNGSFEEGAEVKVMGAGGSELINNSVNLSCDHAFRLGIHFADSHPYEFLKSGVGTVVINNTADNGLCLTTTKTLFGGIQMTFPAPWWDPLVSAEMPNPPFIAERRYRGMGNPGLLMYLGENMQQCKRYALEFYARRTYNSGFAYPAKEEIKFGFTDDAHMQGSTFAGKIENVDLIYSPTSSTPAEHTFKTGEWQKVKISFTYCDTTAANILYLDVHDWWGPTVDPGLSPAPLILDSVSLKEVTTPFSVTASIANPGACEVHLVANPTEIASYGCTGTLFTWTDVSGTVLGTGKELTVSAMTLKSYIIKADDGCGHSAADTIEVTPCGCAPSEVMGTTTFTVFDAANPMPATVSAGSYYVASDMTLSANTTCTGAVMMMAPGVKITVQPTVKFTLDNCHLFTCPDTPAMWQGIVLASTGPGSGGSSARIEIRNNSFIEDAYFAIDAHNLKAPPSGNIIDVTQSTFNRNLVNISAANIYNLAPPGVYPIVINRCLFTARQLDTVTGYPNTWHTPDYLSAALSVTDAKPEYRISREYKKMNCKDGQFAYMGVQFYEIGVTTFSGSAYSYSEVGIGDDVNFEANNVYNLFDNMRYGIHSNNSNTRISNNVFINISKRLEPSTLPGSVLPDDGGLGVIAQSDEAHFNRLRVINSTHGIPNRFHNCYTGIWTLGLTEAQINFNEITSSHSLYLPDAVVPGAAYPTQMYEGEGVKMIGNRNHVLWDINNNKISNMYTGMYLVIDNPRPAAATHVDGNFFFAENQDPVFASYVTGQYMSWGINIWSPTISGTNTISVNSNHFTRVFDGILLNSLRGAKTTANSNIIDIWDKTMLSPGTEQFGIDVWNSYATTIYGNQISTPTLGAVAYADYMKGIYAAQTLGLNVCSNTISHIGRSFMFDQLTPQTGTLWTNNTMSDAWKGFTLASPIGDQVVIGGLNRPAGNKWLGTWSTAKMNTYAIVDSRTSKLNVRSSAGLFEYPLNNLGAAGFSYTTLSPASILTPNTAVYTCAPGTAPLMGSPLALEVLTNSLGADIPPANIWMAQNSLYRAALTDTVLLDSIPALNNFIAAAANSRFAWLYNTETALANGNLGQAQNLLAGNVPAMGSVLVGNGPVVVYDVPDANGVVDNYLRYYGIYLHYLDRTLTGTDTTELETLALKCPAIDGPAVYQARGLLRMLTGLTNDYNDQDCREHNMARLTPGEGNEEAQQGYSLFPNPNQGAFTIRQDIADNKTVRIKVLNAIGAQVYQSVSTFKAGKLNINTGQQVAGLYLVCIDDEKGKSTCLRFVIK